MIRKIDRYRGALLGLATGDALGAPFEAMPPGSFKNVKDITGGGKWNLKPGEWTDDTSMALCLANSLIECNDFVPVDQMQKYAEWYKNGYMSSTGTCFGTGKTTRQAIERFISTGNCNSGSVDPKEAGNGCIMRLAPIPLFYANNREEVLCYSGKSSQLTHACEEAIDSCKYLGLIIAGAINGMTKKQLLSPDLIGQNIFSPLVQEIALGAFKNKEPPEIKGAMYVIKCLEAALWAFYKSNNFEEGCIRAVELGHDTDTTGAVYGQIAGAFYGVKKIPVRWRNKIVAKKDILTIADKLYKLAKGRK